MFSKIDLYPSRVNYAGVVGGCKIQLWKQHLDTVNFAEPCGESIAACEEFADMISVKFYRLYVWLWKPS
jgi:hypothetical protein